LREDAPKGTVADSLDRVVSGFEELRPNYQPVKALRGSVYHLRGQIAEGARAYRAAGYYFPLGDEYKRTVEGFVARGRDDLAWREALLFKFVEPFRPDLHEWLSERLRQQGNIEASRLEAEMAATLESLQKGR
jgi:hypothetical protein